MTNRKISNLEFGVLNFFITRAFLIGITFNTLIEIMKQDSWIIPLISIVPSIIFIIIINYIMNYEPSLNISDKIVKLFEKKIGIFILIILIISSYFICILNYLNLNNFIQSQFLNKTPMFAISIMFAIATLYILIKGVNTVSRTSNILFYISCILFVVSFLGLIPKFDLDNIKPLFTSSADSYFRCLSSYYTFHILPIFLLTIIPKDRIQNPKINKTLFISYIFSAFTLFIAVFQTISTLGYELAR